MLCTYRVNIFILISINVRGIDKVGTLMPAFVSSLSVTYPSLQSILSDTEQYPVSIKLRCSGSQYQTELLTMGPKSIAASRKQVENPREYYKSRGRYSGGGYQRHASHGWRGVLRSTPAVVRGSKSGHREGRNIGRTWMTEPFYSQSSVEKIAGPCFGLCKWNPAMPPVHVRLVLVPTSLRRVSQPG